MSWLSFTEWGWRSRLPRGALIILLSTHPRNKGWWWWWGWWWLEHTVRVRILRVENPGRQSAGWGAGRRTRDAPTPPSRAPCSVGETGEEGGRNTWRQGKHRVTWRHDFVGQTWDLWGPFRKSLFQMLKKKKGKRRGGQVWGREGEREGDALQMLWDEATQPWMARNPRGDTQEN